MAHKVFKSSTIYEIMETMCPPRYHRNSSVTIHALGHMMYGCQVLKCMSCHKAIVLMTRSGHCFHDSNVLIINKSYYSHKYMTISYTYILTRFATQNSKKYKYTLREESIHLIKTSFINRFLIAYMIFFHE